MGALVLAAIVVLGLGVFLFLRITQGAPQYVMPRIREEDMVRIGVTKDTPPLGGEENRKLTGFEADLAQAIGGRMVSPAAVILVPVDNRTCAAKLDVGEVDFLVSMVANVESNDDNYALSSPYYTDEVGILSKDGSGATLEGLVGKRMGVFQGSLGKGILNNTITKWDEKPEVVDYTSFEELSDDLKNGVLDGACAEKSRLQLLDIPGMSMGNGSVGVLHYAVASRSKEVDLAREIQTILRALEEDGTLSTLYQKYQLELPVR